MFVDERTTQDSFIANSCGTTMCNWRGGLWIGPQDKTTTGASDTWHSGVEPFAVESFGGSLTFSINRSKDSWGDDWAASSVHKGGEQTVMGDGAVRFLSENVDLTTYQRIRDRADGQVIGEF